ncbi:MAG: hypothetical protein GX359_12345 [Clostridiales bacterium]|nr:hypothetical protein [Clostridiales bacterium]
MKSTKLKHLPNVLTFCNMAIGILVICLMVHNHSLSCIKLGCYLIYIAVILDLLDGCLARHLNASSDMGKQLDSFADFITFGVAPIALFISNLQSVPWFMMIIIVVYPLAGGYRLARYNLQGHCLYFTGLPITASGFILVTILLINSYSYKIYTSGFIVIYLLLSLALSIMMVSNIRVNRILQVKDICGDKQDIS